MVVKGAQLPGFRLPPGAESLFTPDDVARMSDTRLEQTVYKYEGIIYDFDRTDTGRYVLGEDLSKKELKLYNNIEATVRHLKVERLRREAIQEQPEKSSTCGMGGGSGVSLWS